MEDEMDVMAILDMVSSGKISPDEGVELLEALKASHPQKSTPYEARDTRRIADLRASLEDVGLDDIDFDELNQLRNFGLTPEEVREFNELGVAPTDLEDWESVTIHKVTPSYIREMVDAGLKDLNIDELVNARIHKVTPAVVREFTELGYVDLPMDNLVEFAIHRVRPEMIKEFKEAGLEDLTTDELVECRIHKITPEFIREFRDLGLTDLRMDQLVELRIHNISAKLLKAFVTCWGRMSAWMTWSSSGFTGFPQKSYVNITIWALKTLTGIVWLNAQSTGSARNIFARCVPPAWISPLRIW